MTIFAKQIEILNNVMTEFNTNQKKERDLFLKTEKWLKDKYPDIGSSKQAYFYTHDFGRKGEKQKLYISYDLTQVDIEKLIEILPPLTIQSYLNKDDCDRIYLEPFIEGYSKEEIKEVGTYLLDFCYPFLQAISINDRKLSKLNIHWWTKIDELDGLLIHLVIETFSDLVTYPNEELDLEEATYKLMNKEIVAAINPVLYERNNEINPSPEYGDLHTFHSKNNGDLLKELRELKLI